MDGAAPRAWPRVRWTRAGQVSALLGADAQAVPADLPPAAAFAALRQDDAALAIAFAAQALQRLDAARWLAGCLAAVERPTRPELLAADKAVRRWVASPSDEARRLAWDAGEAAGFSTVQGLACLAIFLSGGSMAPADLPTPVNPAPGAFGQIVGSAVLLAAYAAGPIAFSERASAMLDLADRIAAGEETGA